MARNGAEFVFSFSIFNSQLLATRKDFALAHYLY
jgi:hypothetical protein